MDGLCCCLSTCRHDLKGRETHWLTESLVLPLCPISLVRHLPNWKIPLVSLLGQSYCIRDPKASSPDILGLQEEILPGDTPTNFGKQFPYPVMLCSSFPEIKKKIKITIKGNVWQQCQALKSKPKDSSIWKIPIFWDFSEFRFTLWSRGPAPTAKRLSLSLGDPPGSCFLLKGDESSVINHIRKMCFICQALTASKSNADTWLLLSKVSRML